MTDRALDDQVAGCAAAHRRLLAHLDALLGEGQLDSGVIAQPSRLPGWTVGHVLTHLARNADSHAYVIASALHGEVVDQYPGGMAQRTDDIESGASRPAAEQVDDVRHSIASLEVAWGRCSEVR